MSPHSPATDTAAAVAVPACAVQPAAGVAAPPPAARLAADTNHLASDVAALRLEPAATTPPASTEPRRRTSSLRPDAANEWDRMPGEVQCMILDAAGPFTKFVNGLLVKADLQGLPRHHHERVWQDAIDADWQGSTDLLPHVDTTSRSLSMSRVFLSRIEHRLDPRDVSRLAIRNGWTDMLDFGRPGILAESAACEGSLTLLKELIDSRKAVRPSVGLVELAAIKGHLKVLQFFENRMPIQEWTPSVGYHAAMSGNLELLVWLKEHCPSCIDATALDGAASGNHIHVLRWLADNTAAVCDWRTFQHAAEADSLEMLELLQERFPDALGIPRRSFVSSEVGVLEWLNKRGLMDRGRLTRHIVKKGKIAALEWAEAHLQIEFKERDLEDGYRNRSNSLLKHAYGRGLPFTMVSAQWAARCGNIDMMCWAISRDRNMIPMLVEASASQGITALVEWWRVHHGIVFGQTELEVAICNLCSHFVKHLLEMDDIEWDLGASRAAVAASRHSPLGFSRLRQVIKEAIDAAAARQTRRRRSAQ
ncbi:hypothetical protein HK105_201334 [Polyrhizophydium stewartii]|uniref:Ankyrin repeat protein n=1 Tax=Polyrhizophydium stewartii TaxID=2732419 RepID=A0ABR4NHX2_9FUNG